MSSPRTGPDLVRDDPALRWRDGDELLTAAGAAPGRVRAPAG